MFFLSLLSFSPLSLSKSFAHSTQTTLVFTFFFFFLAVTHGLALELRYLRISRRGEGRGEMGHQGLVWGICKQLRSWDWNLIEVLALGIRVDGCQRR